MKYAVAVLIGATKAIRLGDAPNFFNEPSWRETMPSAAGLAQAQDAPPAFNEPSWRETMPSAAGLHQIHSLAQADPAPKAEAGPGPIGGGGGNYKVTSGIKYDNKGYDLPEKVLQMDPKIGRTHTSFYAQADPAPKAEAGPGPIGGGGANHAVTSKIVFNNKGYAQPEKVLQMDPKIARTHTTFYAQAEPAKEEAKGGAGPIGGGGANYAFTKAIKLNKEGYGAPEKVNVPDPKIARTHTTFYAQDYNNLAAMERKPPGLNPEGPIGGGGDNQAFTSKITRDMEGFFEPEKTLVPDAKIVRNGTTFYAQADPEASPAGPIGGGGANGKFSAAIKRDMKGYQEPEKVNVPDPKIGRTHTTFYSQY